MSETAATTRTWLWGAFFVSMMINCLLVGTIAGHGFAPWFHPSAQPALAAPPTNFAARIKLLPDEERRKFNLAMKPDRDAIRDARAEVTEAKRGFNEALLATPYDPAAMTAALATLRQKNERVQQHVQEATAQALAVLTPESRARLVEPLPH